MLNDEYIPDYEWIPFLLCLIYKDLFPFFWEALKDGFQSQRTLKYIGKP